MGRDVEVTATYLYRMKIDPEDSARRLLPGHSSFLEQSAGPAVAGRALSVPAPGSPQAGSCLMDQPSRPCCPVTPQMTCRPPALTSAQASEPQRPLS